LFGRVLLEDLHNLQRRLAYEAASRVDGRITILACEHEPVITIGRGGSRADVCLDADQLAQHQLEVHYLARGGGAILHGPGQLTLYVIAPLDRLRWTIGDYVHRLQGGLSATLQELKVRSERRSEPLGIWGCTGLLAALGIGVRHGVSQHGVAINVAPANALHRRILCRSGDSRSMMGSLLTEHAPAGRMAAVRSTIIAKLPAALGSETCQMFTGHSLLPESTLERELTRAA
jgi:lipoate-protein ligase B